MNFDFLDTFFAEDGDVTLELSQLVDGWIYPKIKDNLGKMSIK